MPESVAASKPFRATTGQPSRVKSVDRRENFSPYGAPSTGLKNSDADNYVEEYPAHIRWQPKTASDAAADVALIFIYGAVFFFFFVRFLRYRKWPSFYLALSAPMGWVLLSLWDLGIMEPIEGAPLRWLGVLMGMLMLTSVVRWDKLDPPDPKPRRDVEHDEE